MRLLRVTAPVLMLATVCAPAPQKPVVTPPAPKATTSSLTNPNQESNDRTAKEILDRIAGHEKEPAGQVFKNIQIPWLKDVPAGNLINIMNFGYSRALGVACSHCHVTSDFASDDKRPKRAAREMAVMHHAINDQLRKMQNLEDPPEKRLINCSTCHRGSVDPHAVK